MKKLFTSFLLLMFLFVGTNSVCAEDQVLYETGFEAPDFTANTTYNNDSEVAVGSTGQQWMVMEGTASTTSPITDLMSLQMRDYTSNSVKPYAYTNFETDGVKTVNFKAKNKSGLNLIVSYSTDGGTTWLGEENFTLSTSAKSLSYTVGAGNGLNNVRIKFAVNSASTGTNKARMYIDDVQFMGSTGPVTPQVETPIFTPVEGTTFTTDLEVSLSCATADAAIYYTLDGSEPTASATLYDAPFTLSATTTVKAIAIKTDFLNSVVATATYTKTKPAPEFTSNKPHFKGKANRTIATNITCTSSATIVYTTADENIATVNASGVITLVAKGSTTLNVHVDETDNHAAADASYTIDVKGAPCLQPNQEEIFADMMNGGTGNNSYDSNLWVKDGYCAGAGDAFKLGSGGNYGSLTSAYLTTVGEKYKLIFKVFSYKNGEGDLTITYDGENKRTYKESDGTLPSNPDDTSPAQNKIDEVEEFTISFTATTATNIEFKTPEGVRVFVDYIKLEKEEAGGDSSHLGGYWEHGDESDLSSICSDLDKATDLDFTESEFADDFTDEDYPSGMNPNCLVHVDRQGRFSHNNVVGKGDNARCNDLKLTDKRPFKGRIGHATGRYERVFNVAQTDFYTFCSPFDIDIASSGFTAVEEFTTVGNNVITFTPVTTTIEAGKAYLVSTSDNPTPKNFDISDGVVSSDLPAGNLVFKATFEELTGADAEGKYVLVIDAVTQRPVFSRVVAGGTIPPFRCYLEIQSSSSAPKFYSIHHDGEGTTGLENVSESSVRIFTQSGNVYIHSDKAQFIKVFTLEGCCVKEMRIEAGETTISDLPRGMYIINQHKVVIK
jgi:hypothetical protein